MNLNDDLQQAIEQTRTDGHDLEETVKAESKSLSLAGRKLHSAIAKAAEYQSQEINRNQSLLSEIDTRADFYASLKRQLDQVIEQNRQQRRLVAAALRGSIAGQAALDADLTRSGADYD